MPPLNFKLPFHSGYNWVIWLLDYVTTAYLLHHTLVPTCSVHHLSEFCLRFYSVCVEVEL